MNGVTMLRTRTSRVRAEENLIKMCLESKLEWKGKRETNKAFDKIIQAEENLKKIQETERKKSAQAFKAIKDTCIKLNKRALSVELTVKLQLENYDLRPESTRKHLKQWSETRNSKSFKPQAYKLISQRNVKVVFLEIKKKI